MVYSRVWGKLIHEKNQKSKILWRSLFNPFLSRWVRERDRYAPKIHLHETVEELRQFNSRYHIFALFKIPKKCCNQKVIYYGQFLPSFKINIFSLKKEKGV